MTEKRHDVTFIDCPAPIRRAWDNYRAAGGDPVRYRTERRTPERDALERACWETLRRVCVYALIDGYMLGWTGKRGERRFHVDPTTCPRLPRTHVQLAAYYHLYGTCPL
jgi:hypothetical protein